MGFKRTPEGRVFFQGADTANDEAAPRPSQRASNPSPQMRSPLTGEKTQGQIITLLKTLNERLKATQADRDRMMGELEKYRTTIEDLEEKAERNERLALDLEYKLEQQGKQSPNTNAKMVQATEQLAKSTIKELEQTRKALADIERNQAAQNKVITEKVSKSVAGFNAVKKRLEATEAKQGVIDERVEDALSQQAKLIRKVDKAIEDRARFMRKIERIEETVLQTRDSLNAKAMVLLTEQGATATDTDITKGLESLPEDFDAEIKEAAKEAARLTNIKSPAQKIKPDAHAVLPSWKNPAVYGAAAGIMAFILAGLLIGGLALNDWKLPFQNKSADIEVKAYSQSGYEPAQDLEFPPAQNARPVKDLDWTIEAADQGPAVYEIQQKPINDDIGAVDLQNEEQVAALIESNPQKVAEALNKIEPQKQAPIEKEVAKRVVEKAPEPVKQPVKQAAPVIEEKVVDLEATKRPNTQQAKAIASQIQPDKNLPNVIQSVEGQAFRGIGEAQHDLAAIYTAGHGGVEQNYERAAYWFEKASENGIANASYNLGVLHHQGLGFTPDIKKAMKWYKDAAALGHPEAQYNLGIAYIEGIGVPYDPVTASAYFENAANNGVMEAAYNLGLIYENGLLGNAKPDSALMWYKTAADQGSPEAKQALEDLARTLAIDLKDVNSIADSMRTKQNTENTASPVSAPLPDKQSNAVDATTTDVDFSAYSSERADQAIIAQIQEYLMREGLYPGPADGVSGALTQDAIRSYQSQSGLEQTGTASQNLLSHMLANANKSAVFQDATDIGVGLNN